MKRLAQPFTALKPGYEVIIIGSGYGGSIAASRMARAGKKVCLLEKGKEFLPGEFPSNHGEARKEMQFSSGKFDLGSENGLYEFVLGKEISVFKGCGLGGTSLVNANVSIEPEARLMEDKAWPEALRNDPESFEEGLSHARDMLKPNPYPEGRWGYPVLKKTQAMRTSAGIMKEPFRLLDINVNFEDKEQNHAGVRQPKCTNCGDCVTGCNVGAKNTTAMNYLPDAFNHGAEIFTEIHVKYLKRKGVSWRVYFNPLNCGREKFDGPPMFIESNQVILSAGSLGTTEILLRSAEMGLELSDMLGQKFTGNGDVLGFGYNNDVPIHGVGLGDRGTDKVANVGPCITSVVDIREKPDLEDGMTLEEGTFPGPIKSILPSALISFSRLLGKNTDRGVKDFLKEKWRELVSLIGGPHRGALDHTQIYLVMSHDDGNGKMDLDNDQIRIQWKGVGKQDIFKKVSGKLTGATKALGGNIIPNPSWTKLLNYDLVPVHPLGGWVMGDDATKGVVDHKGQVFKGKSGKDLYPGLYVMDGSVIPRPVGTNPLLTISALAERSCKIIAGKENRSFSYEFMTSPSAGMEALPGIQFTETMRGYFSPMETEDYSAGYEEGRKTGSSFEFTLTIVTDNVDKFVTDAAHRGSLSGTMYAPELADGPLIAYNGIFNLFMADHEEPGHKKMNYDCLLKSQGGRDFYFQGFKDVYNNRGLDVWLDTTTLYFTVYNGPSASDPVLGKGKLKIDIPDFMKQITTMKALNPNGNNEGSFIMTFGKFFAGEV